MRFINIGFGNMVACDRVVAVVAPDSAPVKRLILQPQTQPADLSQAATQTASERT